MSNPEIRKLLGGYATNTLTDGERQALFQAALDDQELFNALQDEEALRALLADPQSREKVQKALEDSQRPRVPWWSRRWVWGGTAAAAVAAMAVAVVIQWNPPRPASQPVQVSALRESAKSVAPEEPQAVAREYKNKPDASRDSESAPRSLKKFEPTPASPPVPAAAPTIVAQAQAGLSAGRAQQQAQGGVVGALGGVPPPAARSAVVDKQFAAGFNGPVDLYQGPLLRYSVLRRGARDAVSTNALDEKLKTGDTVQLNVTPGIAGFLAVYRIDKSGESTRVFPTADLAMPVQANATYVVPESPIALREGDERLRIVLAPQEVNSVDKTTIQLAKTAGPLIVDVPIGTN
jgi:hypothetical protein